MDNFLDNFDEMNEDYISEEEDDFLRELGQKIEEYKDNRGPSIINPANMRRFNQALKYFKKFAEKNDGKVEQLDASPRSIHGSFAVLLPAVDIYPGEIPDFIKNISLVDTMSIYPSNQGGVIIYIGVNNLWEEIKTDE